MIRSWDDWPAGIQRDGTANHRREAVAGGYSGMTADQIYENRDELVRWCDLEDYRPG